MKQPIRAVLAGAGFWGSRAHLPALLAQPDVEVIGIVDTEMEAARRLASAHRIPRIAASLNELSVDGIDLVVIAAPTEVHPELVISSLEMGAAVLCEKPLANTVEAAQRLAQLSAHVDVPCSVGYSFRYSPSLQALKADILSGKLGDPWLLEMFEYNAQFHPARNKPLNWKGDPAHARAGALLEYGSHLIDMAGWLAGPIEEVHGALTRVLPESRLDDIATLQVRFRAPAIGVLISGWVLSGSIPGIKIRFHGSLGLAEVELNETLPGGQAYRRMDLDGRAEEQSLERLLSPISGYAMRHVADMVHRLQGKTIPFPYTLPTFEDGVRVQQVLEASLASTGGWVHPGSQAAVSGK